MGFSTQDLELNMNRVISQAVQAQLVRYTGDNLWKIDSDDHGKMLGQVLAGQMVLLVVTGNDLRLTLKLHYKSGDIAKIIARSRTDQGVSASAIIDYTKELQNQICGRICRDFGGQNIELGMSIPLRLRGFYEVYADYRVCSDPLLKFGHLWRLVSGDVCLYFSSYVEISDRELLGKVSHSQISDDDSSLEFL